MNAIKFGDLENINDSEYLIMMSLLVNEENYQATVDIMNEQFREFGLIGPNDEVIKLSFVTGNVLGEEGRSDWLLQFSERTTINPIKRLMISDLKWVSDFIVNNRQDYSDE
jgi:hypothetical protein